MDEQTRARKTTDALIARGFADTHPPGDCPEPGVLAAFHERTLEADETQRWLGHVADCARCQALLAALGRAEPDSVVPQTDGSTVPWWRWRVLAPLATVSIVVLAVWVGDPGSTREGRVAVEQRQDPPPTLRERAAAEPESTESRPVPETIGVPVAVPESTIAAVTRTNAAPSREVATVPRAEAAAATPAAPAPLARSAASTSAPPPTATGNAVGRPDAPGLRRTALASDAARRLESAQFADVAAPDALLVVSPDPSIRWRVVPGGAVERSDDRGATWRVQVTPGAQVIAGSAPSARVAWLVGENGLVLRTTDGERWERTTAPTATHLTDIDALDQLDATVWTADDRRFRTVDGGARWVEGRR